MSKLKSYKQQHGQTLVETMVAVFILVMGITAALGLANFSLGASTTIRKQIVAMGLAREGIEAVKNMRDTNWLNADKSITCYDYLSQLHVATCYPNWQKPDQGGDPGYDIRAGTYALTTNVNLTGVGYWTLASRGSQFGLNYDNSASPQHGLYSSFTPTNFSTATSDYARRIVITEVTAQPFNNPGSTGLGPMLKVSSQVWWKDKRCPVEEVPNTTKCIVKLETYLTNWKDY